MADVSLPSGNYHITSALFPIDQPPVGIYITGDSLVEAAANMAGIVYANQNRAGGAWTLQDRINDFYFSHSVGRDLGDGDDPENLFEKIHDTQVQTVWVPGFSLDMWISPISRPEDPLYMVCLHDTNLTYRLVPKEDDGSGTTSGVYNLMYSVDIRDTTSDPQAIASGLQAQSFRMIRV